MSYRDTVATVTAFFAMRPKKPSAVGFQRRIHIGAEPGVITKDAKKFKEVAERRAKNFQLFKDIAQKAAKGETPSILAEEDKFFVISFKASMGSIPIILPMKDQKTLMDLYNATADDMLHNPDIDYVAAFDKTSQDFPSPVQEVTPTEFITTTVHDPGTVETRVVKEAGSGGGGGAGAGVAIAFLGALGIAAAASKKKHS